MEMRVYFNKDQFCFLKAEVVIGFDLILRTTIGFNDAAT